jgi:hypothetical protein
VKYPFATGSVQETAERFDHNNLPIALVLKYMAAMFLGLSKQVKMFLAMFVSNFWKSIRPVVLER